MVNHKEKEKWDSIYESSPVAKLTDQQDRLAIEFKNITESLLPSSARLLEAGCGTGAQSLLLAQSGYDTTLMDFSENALKHAEYLYKQNNARAEFVRGDLFESGSAEHDFVYNFGVLEHYDFEQQVKALRAMATRSKRYVGVAVPNRNCYWYWLWRYQVTSDRNWFYGKEIPTRDLRGAFEAAGLNYIGQKHLASDWTEDFITTLSGLDNALCQQILDLHRSGLIAAEHRSYLVFELASVEPTNPVAGWNSPATYESPLVATQIATLSDAMASVTTLLNATHDKDRQMSELHLTLETLRSQQQFQVTAEIAQKSLEEDNRRLRSKITRLETELHHTKVQNDKLLLALSRLKPLYRYVIDKVNNIIFRR